MGRAAVTAITMTDNMDDGALYRLMAWLSPAYPVGAFSYSHGIEWMVETGDIHDGPSLATAVAEILCHGGGRNDAIFFAETWRAVTAQDEPRLAAIVALGGAAVSSAERALETLSQGRAFAETTSRTWQSATLSRLVADEDLPLAYPVAVAAAVADHGIALRPALSAYLHAFAANLVSAGVRLIPLGHTAGQIVLTQLEPAVTAGVDTGLASTLDDMGGCAFAVDMAAMKHETQYTRLFRS